MGPHLINHSLHPILIGSASFVCVINHCVILLSNNSSKILANQFINAGDIDHVAGYILIVVIKIYGNVLMFTLFS